MGGVTGTGWGDVGRPALRRGLLCWVVSPGMHLLLSLLVERRRVTWATEYPAVLVGDTALAVAAGLGRWAGGPVDDAAPWRRRVRGTAAVGGLLFGVWQLRREVRTGAFPPAVAFGPTKLWHQFVTYPVLSGLVAVPLLDGTRAALRPDADRAARVAVAAGWACVVLWALLVVEAWHHPRPAHGSWPGR
jgi:hypothetical protein